MNRIQLKIGDEKVALETQSYNNKKGYKDHIRS